jgi:hypothetical protein
MATGIKRVRNLWGGGCLSRTWAVVTVISGPQPGAVHLRQPSSQVLQTYSEVHTAKHRRLWRCVDL